MDQRSEPFPSLLQSDRMAPEFRRVLSNTSETSDIFTLRLEPGRDQGEPPFLPGQFNMLYAFGVGESAISISGNPTDRGFTMHTIRRVGVVTQALEALQKDEFVGVRGPFGRPWPLEKARGRDVVIIAGGIGLAPLRPVVECVLSNSSDYGRLSLLVGARDPSAILFRDELSAWKAEGGIDLMVTVDHADARWSGNVGVVTNLVKRAVFDPQNSIAFICGPEAMMRYAVYELKAHRLGSDQIYLSLERNMKCAIGFCGHCQFGPEFICRDGPVFRHDRIAFWLNQREI